MNKLDLNGGGAKFMAIVTIDNKSQTSLHQVSQVNPIKGERRYFLDGKWDHWIKLENKKVD